MHIGTSVRSLPALIEVSIVGTGTLLDIYRGHDGTLYVPSVIGQAFALRVRNLAESRIEVITSVDGRNTLKDEAADSRKSTGMILRAGETYDFDGWRENDDHTRQFVFDAPQRSVAVRAGAGTSNIGVIGFAVWRERPHYIPYGYNKAEPFTGVAPVAMASAGDYGSLTTRHVTMDSSVTASVGSVGTGIGERQDSKVSRTSFDREQASGPDILAIQYDTLAVLDTLGVTGPPPPSPFPGAGTGYENF